MQNFSAALWDMDGTLVDTEPYWMDAETALMAEHGLPWTHELAMQMVGNDLRTSARILQDAGLPLGVDETVGNLVSSVRARIREHVPFVPGARELLEGLTAAGVPNVLVTMSYRSLAEAVLESLPTGTFAHLVTGDEVPVGKPDPAPYLLAAASLNLPPEECVAFEDSIPGITSAEAAGTRAIGIPNHVAIPEAPGRMLVDTLAGRTPADIDALVGAMGD